MVYAYVVRFGTLSECKVRLGKIALSYFTAYASVRYGSVFSSRQTREGGPRGSHYGLAYASSYATRLDPNRCGNGFCGHRST